MLKGILKKRDAEVRAGSNVLSKGAGLGLRKT